MKQCSEHFKICKNSLKCQKCAKVFDKLNIYHAHITICDGLDKYKCSGCGMCFSEKSRLTITCISVERSSHVRDVVFHFRTGKNC